MSVPRTRRPGDRVVRKRVHSTQTFELPPEGPRPEVPSVRRHAKVFTAGFFVFILLASIMLSLPWASRSGETTPFVDAFFTAISAASVTGLVVVDTQTHWNWLGQVIILFLIQAGGLGFMVGASIILRMLQRGAGGLRESMLLQDGSPTLSLREATELSRKIVKFTFAVEAVGAIVLAVRFAQEMPIPEAIWHGIFHSVSAFCNAGFDLQGGFQSLAAYEASITINVAIIMLIQMGALSYIVFEDMWRKKKWDRFALETKIVLVLNTLLVVVGAAMFLIAEWNASLAPTETWTRVQAAIFQSAASRTAGYATVDMSAANDFTHFTWSVLMFIGGASGSTAGGVKLTTVGVVAVAVYSTLRGRTDPQLFERRIPIPLIFRAMAVIALMFAAHFLITLSLAVTETLYGADPSFLNLFFEAMSGLATVGLSTGITPELSTAGKLILCFGMFFGRIGPLTAVYALQRRQSIVKYRFPESPVRIG